MSPISPFTKKEASSPDNSASRRHKLKVPRRYRLLFVNESTLNSVWTIGMSRGRMRLYVAIIVVALVMLGSFIISFTPLRTLLPGYLRQGERREYIAASERLDSIVDRAKTVDAYLTNLNDILSDNIDVDSLMSAPVLLDLTDADSMVGPSSAEAAYVEQYLARENFNIDARMADASVSFLSAPVDGAIVARGSTPEATTITLPRHRRVIVKSIGEGVVVDAAKGSSGRYTVIVQHPDGFVSRTAGLEECFVSQGQKLEPETRLGIVDATKDNRLDFSLWQTGNRVEPSRLIAF